MKKFDNLIESIYECSICLLGLCLFSFGLFCFINDDKNPTIGIVFFLVFIIMFLILLIFVLIFGFRYYIINDNELMIMKLLGKKLFIRK